MTHKKKDEWHHLQVAKHKLIINVETGTVLGHMFYGHYKKGKDENILNQEEQEPHSLPKIDKIRGGGVEDFTKHFRVP